MRVTIIADASFCPDTNAAGYGYWIACDRGKTGGGDEMKGRVPSSMVAEMQAVVNALYVAARLSLVQQGDSVLIQTDCLAAIDTFEGRREFLNGNEIEVLKAMSHVRSKLELTILFRHVKGHTRNREARFVTNNLCDERAKTAMRRARARFRTEG